MRTALLALLLAGCAPRPDYYPWPILTDVGLERCPKPGMTALELRARHGRALRERHFLPKCSASYVDLTPDFTGTVFYPATTIRL